MRRSERSVVVFLPTCVRAGGAAHPRKGEGDGATVEAVVLSFAMQCDARTWERRVKIHSLPTIATERSFIIAAAVATGHFN